MSNKKRLTFFTTESDAFLRDLIIRLRSDYDIKFFSGGNEQEFFQMWYDCDIAWMEWCNQLALNASTLPDNCKTVVRLHSYELFTDLPGKMNWKNIEKLILVSATMKQLMGEKFKVPEDIMCVIPNGVDMEKFKIPKDKKYNKKIAYVGYLNYKKAPELMIPMFHEIWKYDQEYEFHIAGVIQDERLGLYLNHIGPKLPFKIYFDGWQKDVSAYLEDKDYVISTSIFESFQYSLAEGMSQGCIPLIHGWRGSDMLYPSKYIYYTPEECVNIVKKVEKTDIDKERLAVREHIMRNFSLDSQIDKIKEMLDSLDK